MKEADKKLLLELSKNTLAKSLDLPFIEIDASKLNKKVGAFVTLRKNEQLRGCIGNIYGKNPLYKEIIELTQEAAFNDYRFPPVTKEEFESIKFEISVLTQPKEITNLKDFILSRDGIILVLGYKKSVFLPQVADETGWTKDQLLTALSIKAGLDANAYKNPNTIFYTFRAEVF